MKIDYIKVVDKFQSNERWDKIMLFTVIYGRIKDRT